MRCGVVVFPGSNCDHDAYHVLKHVLDQDTTFLWHQDDSLHGCDLVVWLSPQTAQAGVVEGHRAAGWPYFWQLGHRVEGLKKW